MLPLTSKKCINCLHYFEPGFCKLTKNPIPKENICEKFESTTTVIIEKEEFIEDKIDKILEEHEKRKLPEFPSDEEYKAIIGDGLKGIRPTKDLSKKTDEIVKHAMDTLAEVQEKPIDISKTEELFDKAKKESKEIIKKVDEKQKKIDKKKPIKKTPKPTITKKKRKIKKNCRYCKYWNRKTETPDAWAYCDITGELQPSTYYCQAFKVIKKGTKEKIPDWIIISNTILRDFDLITLKDSRQIMCKKSSYYSFDISEVENEISKKLEMYQVNSYKTVKGNILEYIRDQTPFDRDKFTYSDWIINFKNGIYFIENNEFHKYNPDIDINELPEPVVPTKEWIKKYRKKLFYEIPFEYELGVKYKCRKFKKALRKWLTPSNVVRPADIFEIFGYFLCLNNSLKTAFMFYGEPDTGKSQLANILIYLLSKRNISTISLQRLNKRFGAAPLQFIIGNIYPEMPYSKLIDVGVFKAFTGADMYVPGEIKGGKIFNFRPITRFLFTCNKIAKIENLDDNAFFIRWILINFPTVFKFENNDRVQNFYKTIIEDPEEIKGIIYESVKAVKRLYKRGHYRLKLYQNTKHIWNYNSDEIYAFVYDYCEKKNLERIQVDDFFDKFNEISPEGKSKQVITKTLYKMKVNKKKGRISGTDDNKYFYYGIKWKDGVFEEKKEEPFIIDEINLSDFIGDGE